MSADAEVLRGLVEKLTEVYAAVETQLALNHPEPALVTDAATGRYILLDALVVVLQARVALAGMS